MNILLDTHVLIWLAEMPNKVPHKTRIFIEENDVLISSASIWEMAVKITIGKLKLSVSLKKMTENFQDNYDFELLNIGLQHIYQTQQLPLHHRDPFDRLIIAQSIVEKIDIVSSDEAFDAYGIRRIW